MFTVDWTTPPEMLKPCPDCGGSPTLLTDYVLDPKGHAVAQLLIILDPHAPVAEVVLHLQHAIEKQPFSLRMERVEKRIGSAFTDPRDEELGALTRKQALKHPLKDAVFEVLDLVCDVDPRVHDHFFTKSNTTH